MSTKCQDLSSIWGSSGNKEEDGYIPLLMELTVRWWLQRWEHTVERCCFGEAQGMCHGGGCRVEAQRAARRWEEARCVRGTARNSVRNLSERSQWQEVKWEGHISGQKAAGGSLVGLDEGLGLHPERWDRSWVGRGSLRISMWDLILKLNLFLNSLDSLSLPPYLQKEDYNVTGLTCCSS